MCHPLNRALLPDLVIGGPTASGKTALAVDVALKCNGEIINADAFQIYQRLSILTAQPSPEDLARVPHHLIGTLPLSETLDASQYLALFTQKIREIRSRHRSPILVGGTGLYIRTALFGLAPGLPAPDPILRRELELLSLEQLQTALAQKDPATFDQIDKQNPRRLIRALEVCTLTGRSFSSFKHDTNWPHEPIGLWITWPRETLRERIHLRTKNMLQGGVIDEVQSAIPLLGQTAAQAIGIQPIREYIEGRSSLESIALQIETETAQYAKRQNTWFQKESALRSIPPDEALEFALETLRKNQST